MVLISSTRSLYTITMGACILLVADVSDVFSYQPKLSHQQTRIKIQPPASSIQDRLFFSDASIHSKGVHPLKATPCPDYSSFSGYTESLTQASAYESPWALGFAATILLLIGIFTDEDICVNGGFCVTGYDCDGTYTEGDVIVTNSHKLAWYVDLVLCSIAIGLPLLSVAGVDIPPLPISKTPFKPSPGNVILFVGLILGHGYLHGEVLAKPYRPPEDSKGIDSENGSTIGFIVFSAILSLAVITTSSSLSELLDGIGIPKDSTSHKLAEAAIIAASTGILSVLSIKAQDRGLAPISVYFASTQLLVTAVALFIPDDQFADATMGWLFAITCLVSLLEFNFCESFLRRLGGHAWYDWWLHLSVLSGLWIKPDQLEKAIKFISY